jgi:UDP-glucose 4-epimerase
MGRHAAKHAAENGHYVIGIGRGNWETDEWRAWGVSDWHPADITVDNLRACAKRPDAILHFAGSASVPLSLSSPLQDFERTVLTTAQVLEYLRIHSPNTRLVYSSSASVYGAAERVPIPEQTSRAPVSPYGVHKGIAEQLIESYAHQYKLSASIVRFFSVHGRGLRKQLLWDACRKLTADDTVFMGTGDEIRDWLHVEDAANLMLLATRHANPLCPVVNGGSGTGVTVREIITHLSNALPFASEKPQFSGQERIGDPKAFVADISRAMAWGWRPKKSWQEGVADYANWWSGANNPPEALFSQSLSA